MSFIKHKFILIFDVVKSVSDLNLNTEIAVPVNPDSFSSIKKSIEKLINVYYNDDNFFVRKRLRIPSQLELDNLYCYSSDRTLVYCFNITELID